MIGVFRAVSGLASALTVVLGVGFCVSASAAPPMAGAPSGSTVLFHLTDPRIDEASGIAAGIVSPGVIYVHNDSGDSARFFALDARTGRTLAVYTVPGASNVDWEDIAVAPDSRGVASVWIGDIGDNGATRSEIAVYRVDEPHVDRSRIDVAATTTAAQTWRLRYPSGPADAESLAVSPTGTAYVLTKSVTGICRVYAAPARPDASRVQALRAIGSVRFAFTATPGGPNQFGQLTATAADLSRDGKLLVVRTYTDAYLWRVRDADVGAAIRSDPVRVALPNQPQGEGIAFDGSRLLTDSERVGSAVYAVAMPVQLTTPGPNDTPVGGSVRPTGSAASSPRAGRTRPPAWVQVGAAVLVVAMVVVTERVLGRERRERRRQRRRES